MAVILVIDDDAQVCDLLVRLFQSSGHTVFAAENGALGLEILENKNVDLVITDIFMPEKEGLETIIEIKRDFPGIKIIAISGGDAQGNDYLTMVKPLGAEEALSKPFSNEQIVEVVERILAR